MSENKTPAEQRDIFRPELFYNYISLRLKNKPMHYKNANKFEEKKTLIHRTPFQRKPLIYYFRELVTFRLFGFMRLTEKKESFQKIF